MVQGDGFTGGATGSCLSIFFHHPSAQKHNSDINNSNIYVYLTPPHKSDIICQASILKNKDGAYTCEYRSPEKRGHYDLYIKVDGDLLFGSPCPIFFYNDGCHSKSRARASVEPLMEYRSDESMQDLNVTTNVEGDEGKRANLSPHAGDSETQHFSAHYRLSVHAAFQKAQFESHIVKAFDVSPLLSVDKLQRLLSCCSRPMTVEFRDQNAKRTAVIKFSSIEGANKSLKLSGMLLGDRDIKLEKWIDTSNINRSIVSSTPCSLHHRHCTCDSPCHANMNSPLITQPETFKIDPNQWRQEWKAKQLQQQSMMEQYASLVATSRCKTSKHETNASYLINSSRGRDYELLETDCMRASGSSQNLGILKGSRSTSSIRHNSFTPTQIKKRDLKYKNRPKNETLRYQAHERSKKEQVKCDGSKNVNDKSNSLDKRGRISSTSLSAPRSHDFTISKIDERNMS